MWVLKLLSSVSYVGVIGILWFRDSVTALEDKLYIYFLQGIIVHLKTKRWLHTLTYIEINNWCSSVLDIGVIGILWFRDFVISLGHKFDILISYRELLVQLKTKKWPHILTLHHFFMPVRSIYDTF